MKHKLLPPSPSNKTETTEIICRGCLIGYRGQLWNNYFSSISDEFNKSIDNSYLIFEEEPTNRYDKNAIKIICKGEFYGLLGYVGREYTAKVKEILSTCNAYRIDTVSDSKEHEITLIISWI